MMGFHYAYETMIRRLHVPLAKPEEVNPHLGKQELHWLDLKRSPFDFERILPASVGGPKHINLI
jgi:hypothetical protein